MDIIKNIVGKSKKRRCRNCGKVHHHMPFTDCFSEEHDGPLPDSLEDYYERNFGR